MADSASRPRLHIVGCHRSGTTLLMELMWSYFEFGGRTEHEVSLFEPIPPGDGIYLTKKPPDTVRIEKAFLADEHLFVIAMLRDPRAVITSRHPNKPDVYFSSFRRWRQYVQAIERLQDHPRYLVIRYEDLVTDPDAQQDRIQRQFPFLRAVGRFAQYPQGVRVPDSAALSLNGLRPFDDARMRNWMSHLPRVKGQLARYPALNDDLIRLGYETSTAWNNVLEGVEPYSQTYKEEAPHFFKRMESRFRYWRREQRYLAERKLA